MSVTLQFPVGVRQFYGPDGAIYTPDSNGRVAIATELLPYFLNAGFWLIGETVDLSAQASGILGSANGGTGNGFTKFSGPATAERTFTLPNASATILTTNAAITPAQGGTGKSSYSQGDILYASAAAALSALAKTATANQFIKNSGTDNNPAWASITRSDISDLSAYGEMFCYENVTVTPIDTANVYHAVRAGIITGLVSGFTFAAGDSKAISAYADYGGTVAGTVQATSAAHGLTTGDIVTIAGTTNYNGARQITKIDDNNFYFTAAWVADDGASNWYKPACLICNAGYGGVYKVQFNCTAFSAAPNKLFKVEANVNLTALDNIGSSRMFSSTDYGQLTASGMSNIAVGDKVWLSVKGQTDATDITIRHCNVNVVRL